MANAIFFPVAHAAIDAQAFGTAINPIIREVVYPALGLLFGIAVLIFVYGAVQFVIYGDDTDAREKGKTTMLWGTFGLFIMVSAWGIIYLVSGTVKSL